MSTRRAVRKSKIHEIASRLDHIRRTATMDNMSVDDAYPKEEVIPAKRDAVSDFIRKRTELWRNSWVVHPLEEIIEELRKELER